jgi:hypothetical protein
LPILQKTSIRSGPSALPSVNGEKTARISTHAEDKNA